MKSKFLLSTLIFICLFLTIFFNNCKAENENYNIFIKDTSTDFVKSIDIGGTTYEYYDIRITLHNSGDVISDNITVKLQDELDNYTQNKKVNPGEDETFTFTNHPLPGEDQHTLYVSYYATDLDKRGGHNTGSTTITTDYSDNENNDSIPGFGIITLLWVILLLFITKKVWKK